MQRRQGLPGNRLLEVIRSLPAVERQNRLARIGDREIALTMMYMSDRDRALVLSHLPPQKTRRVREELELQRHLAIRYPDYLLAVAHVESNLRRPTSRTTLGSWLRPRR